MSWFKNTGDAERNQQDLLLIVSQIEAALVAERRLVAEWKAKAETAERASGGSKVNLKRVRHQLGEAVSAAESAKYDIEAVGYRLDSRQHRYLMSALRDMQVALRSSN